MILLGHVIPKNRESIVKRKIMLEVELDDEEYQKMIKSIEHIGL